MMRELRFHPTAPKEARYFYRYYADITEALAEDFWRELIDAIEYAREIGRAHV